MKNIDRRLSTAALLLTAAISLTAFYMTTGVEAQSGACAVMPGHGGQPRGSPGEVARRP